MITGLQTYMYILLPRVYNNRRGGSCCYIADVIDELSLHFIVKFSEVEKPWTYTVTYVHSQKFEIS